MPMLAAVLVAAMAGLQPAVVGDEVDLVSLDMGGHVESVTSEGGVTLEAIRLVDGNPRSSWMSGASGKFPEDIVFSFFGRQPAVIRSITLVPGRELPTRPKDVEVWISTESPTAGFTRLAAFTAARDGLQSFPLGPAEARFVKLSILSNYGDPKRVSLSKVRIIEGTRPGYQPLLARNADLAALAAGRVPPQWNAAAPARTATRTTASVPPLEGCSAPRDVSAASNERPRHAESRNVLVITREKNVYPPVTYKARDASDVIYARLNFRMVWPGDARPAVLGDAEGIDTVVFSQVCDIQKSVSAGFKEALAAWIAAGHKLIIHDADRCGGRKAVPPDYGFLPFRLATSSPGALGAKSSTLALVEESELAHSKPSHPAFVDVGDWKRSWNELGDSNSVSEWDAHWCGVLVGTNALGVSGFQEAYAHHGRGLIIYDGFDWDQGRAKAYRQLVTRELAVPFDPDPLSCSVPLTNFVITTESPLRVQPIVPGRTYEYPLTLLSNQRYAGQVKLSMASSPADAGVSGTFQPESVTLGDRATSTLTVKTAPGARRAPHVLAVRGVDANGKAAALCLSLVERKTGGLKIETALAGPSGPTSRNLEIILDMSGSMKLPLGKTTRIATAREVLETVLAKIPDDFNVGLRLYGHRFASHQQQTCTDSQLVLPLQKLNRARILSIVDRTQPRGETPLVYSVLQTVGDLKAAGGGSVVLITDGEESCHGDPAAAARELKNSGLDLRLNIVGFTVKGKETQQTLATLAGSTGGRFYSAQNGDALGRALLAAAVSEFPFEVFDAAGKSVGSGQVGGDALELPPGQYKGVVAAADEQVVASQVAIGTGSDVTLRLALKDGHFVIAR
jgi:hypothetical protein